MKTLLFILLIVIIILIFITLGLILDLRTLRKEMLNKFKNQEEKINIQYQCYKTNSYTLCELIKDKANLNIHHELLKHLLPTIPGFEIEDYQNKLFLYKIKYKSKDGLIVKATYDAKTNKFLEQE